VSPIWTRGWPQQLFRVLAYVLNHAEVTTHGTENAISMTDWLLGDPLLRFSDTGQRRRLRGSLQAFDEKLGEEPGKETAAGAFRMKLTSWCEALDEKPSTT
jgi:hypothetical protein